MNKTTLISALKVLDIPENTWTVNYDLLQVIFPVMVTSIIIFYQNLLNLIQLMKFSILSITKQIRYHQNSLNQRKLIQRNSKLKRIY